MSQDDAEPLDQMLGEHFRRRLDPQVGRASAAFEATAAMTTPAAARSRRWMIPVALSAGGLIAATIMIALPLLRDQPPGREHPPTIASLPRTSDASHAVDYEHLVMWRAVDEGAQVVEADVPVRKLRYEAVEQIQWDDPIDQATIQLSVPVAQVIFVQQQTF